MDYALIVPSYAHVMRAVEACSWSQKRFFFRAAHSKTKESPRQRVRKVPGGLANTRWLLAGRIVDAHLGAGRP